ncbi:hypothetical protein [Salinimicrobium sp. GXAS 041]|uniref:hypothetical protein n=1 Tax=Salinimicrobium sp. GXAS 041 TaxID=3400806 RepID=UPI003C74BCE7
MLSVATLWCTSSMAQTLQFTGSVVNQTDAPLTGASIMLLENERILGYDHADDLGRYSIVVEKRNLREVRLEVKSMSVKNQAKTISLSEQVVYKTDFRLEEEIQMLSTVVISPDKKIELKKDTVVYKVSRFINETERTVEDVLQNIPGIEIDENGNIKAHGQNIQKILIEGDDLANSNYKVISQNLDAQVLDKVEVISNYDENPVLKQFLSSNAKVLNLKLKEDAKSVIFGNIEAGAGIDNRYLTDVNLGLIRPEIKFLDLGKINNTGKTAGDQLNDYIFGQQGFHDFNQNFKIKNDPPVYLTGSSIMLKDRFYVENNRLANNLLLNKTLKEKTKLRASLFVYKDLFEKEYSGVYEYFIEPENILFTERNTFHIDNRNFSNDIEFSHSLSKNDFVNFRNSLHMRNDWTQNRIIFNNQEVIDQHLKDRNVDLETNLKYTRKLEGGAAVFYLYFGSKNLEQNLSISPNTIENEQTTGSVLQSYNETKIEYQGFQTDLIFKKKRLSYSFSGGIRNFSEALNFKLGAGGNRPGSIDSLSKQNKAVNLASNIKFKSDYQISPATNFNMSIDAVHTHYDKNGKTKNFLFVNSDAKFSTRTKIGNFRLGYSYESEIPRLRYFIDNYLVLNYRMLRTGAREVEEIYKHRYAAGYTFSRPEKRILFTITVSYTAFENQLVTNSYLSRDLNVSRFTYQDGQNFLLFNSGFTTYVDKLHTTVKLGLTHTLFENPSVINNRELVISNQMSSIYIRGTSYFKGAYNFKFSATGSINKGRIQGNEVSNRRYNAELENILRISNRFFGNFKNEFFLIESELYESSTVGMEYRPIQSDWVFGLRSQNIFNTKEYVFANVTDYQQTNLIYKAVPRYFLCYAKVRF